MRKALLYTLLTPGVLLIASCGGNTRPPAAAAGEAVATDSTLEAAPARAEEPSGPVVLVFGDSIAAGYGVEPEQAFPARLQARLDSAGVSATVINGGLSGETSAGGLRRIDWMLQRPIDVLFLELGGNDGLRGVDLASTRANLRQIVDRARVANQDLVLVVAGMMIPPNLGQDYTREFARMYPELAEEYDGILIPFLLDGVGGIDSLMQNDGIHPNAAGHRAVAAVAEPYVRQALGRVPD